jgi:hypothetical protein
VGTLIKIQAPNATGSTKRPIRKKRGPSRSARRSASRMAGGAGSAARQRRGTVSSRQSFISTPPVGSVMIRR